MKSICRRAKELADGDLRVLSRAIHLEIQRRRAICAEVPDLAVRRFVPREQSDHRGDSDTIPLVCAVGTDEAPLQRRAA